MNKTVVVVNRITNSCVGQAVIALIIVVSVQYEQWRKSSEHNKQFLSEVKLIFASVWFAIKLKCRKLF